MINDKRRVMIAICSTVVFLLSGPALQGFTENTTQVMIHLSKDHVEKNDAFFVIISINQSEPIIGVQINLLFNPSLIQVTNVSTADPVWDFFGSPLIDNTGGAIRGAGVAVMGTTLSTPTDCFNISFITLDKDGRATLTLQEIIVLNTTVAQIEPIIATEQTIIIGKGSVADPPGQAPGSFPPDDDESAAPGSNQTPVIPVVFTYSPAHPKTGENITFQVNVDDIEEDIIRFQWEFGDSNTSTDQDPTHRYSAPGLYLVTLHLWDGNDDLYTGSKNITVIAAQPDSEETPNDQDTATGGESGYGFIVLFLVSLIVVIIIINKRKSR